MTALRRLRLLLLSLSLSGCATMVRPTEWVEADIQQHLTTRYGEDFVVTSLRTPSWSGGRFPDAYNYEAHPKADPTLVFRGRADYDARPNKVTDLYACEQIRRWLPGHVLAALGDGYRFEKADVRCSWPDELPAHPPVGAPLPKGMVSLHAELESYRDGDPVAVAAEARAKFLRVTGSLRVHPRGIAESFPSTVWPYASTYQNPDDFGRPPEGWHTLALGYASIDRKDEPAERYVTDPDLKTRIEAVVAELPGVRSSVVVGQRGRVTDGRFDVDVRIGRDGLDLDTMKALAERVGEAVGTNQLELRGIDGGPPPEPARRAFVCRKLGCKEVSEPLLDPALVAPALPPEAD